MLILGIESSCDDTSVCLLEAKKGEFKILALKTASQVEVHKKYGGVVPEVAGRCHAENIWPVIEEVMNHKNKKTLKHENKNFTPDVIAVTAGPGLITGLLVGVEAAKVLSYLWRVPLVPVNHLEGHIYSVLLKKQGARNKEQKTSNDKKQTSNRRQSTINPPDGEAGNEQLTIEFPALCLIVSGGHTELILMKDHGRYERLGATLDDAAGECFDKVAKLLGLDYPGGPKISKLAEGGNPKAIDFPRPMLARRSPKGEDGINDDTFNFSFAGLKTAALYWLRDNERPNKKISDFRFLNLDLKDFCASFEQAIIDVLTAKTLRAAEKYQPKMIILSGGVSANKKLRATLQAATQANFPQTPLLIPELTFTMDNAAMIAAAGYFHARKKKFTPRQKVMADPNWRLG